MARIETFVVGGNVTAGERQQWVVEGGKYKSSFLLADEDGGNGSEEGLLISETVVPGFEYVDHDYLGRDRMEALLTEGEIGELEWLLRENMVDGT
ncbi:hypothetical protein HII31_07822 [Pseudocercospora fuligena]|uniref:DUF985 domain-containing protein n=1 Tax=Pseudocercospora fuligena TaxID=685502 RepID=A0A8H6VFR3_9PEZI|nr:hypothetical protein HII31_07822 [Pseudocercospora fuligena]